MKVIGVNFFETQCIHIYCRLLLQFVWAYYRSGRCFQVVCMWTCELVKMLLFNSYWKCLLTNQFTIGCFRNKYLESWRRRLTLEEVGNRLQLWNVIFAEAAVVDKQWKHVIELLARVSRVQPGQLAEHSAPRPPMYSQPQNRIACKRLTQHRIISYN